MSQYEDRECPKCHGKMWDNRTSKKNPKAPDFKCRDKSCDGVIWPSRGNEKSEGPSNPFKEPEWAQDQERVEENATKAIKQGDSDADKLMLLEQRMNACCQAAERITARNENVVTDPQAIAISFFIELNKQGR